VDDIVSMTILLTSLYLQLVIDIQIHVKLLISLLCWVNTGLFFY